MDRNEAIERAFDSWWCGMAHPAGAHHPSNMIRSAFKAGHRAALAMPEAKVEKARREFYEAGARAALVEYRRLLDTDYDYDEEIVTRLLAAERDAGRGT